MINPAAMPSETDPPFQLPDEVADAVQPFGIAYKITNVVTGAAYIGVTRLNLWRRIKNHRHSAKRESNILYRAIRKYGWSNFTVEVLASACDAASLAQIERDLISLHKTHARAGGYNMTGGGEGTPDICDETRANMRRAAAARLTPENRAKISASLKGRPFPPHVRAARIASQTGRPLTAAHKASLSKGHSGKIISVEQRAKISESLKAYYRKRTPAHD